MTTNPAFKFLNDGQFWFILSVFGLAGGGYGSGIFGAAVEAGNSTLGEQIGLTIAIIVCVFGAVCLVVGSWAEMKPFADYGDYLRDANERLADENIELTARNLELKSRLTTAEGQLAHALTVRNTAAVSPVKDM